MRFRLFALLSVFAALCLSAGAQAPAGFIPVSGTQLVDSNGIPIANAALCAQATIAGQPASIHVGGAGNTTMSQVCTNVVNGVFSFNLPNMSLTTPKYACLKLTAIDNVSGSSLLTGFDCVQPRSVPPPNVVDFWCTSTSCNFDKLPPNYPATDVFVAPQGIQGPQGATGSIGPAGIVTASGVNGAFQVPGLLFPYLSYNTFGDSIVARCCTENGLGFVDYVGQAIGLTPNNPAVSGDTSADQATEIYATNIMKTGNQLNLYEIGTNDMFVSGTSAQALGRFRAIHEAEVAWLAIPADNKVLGQQILAGTRGSCAGSWVASSTMYGGVVGIQSATSGDTCTFTTYGPTAYIVYSLIPQTTATYAGQASGNATVGGTFTLSVDGVVQPTTRTTATGESATITFPSTTNQCLSQHGRTYAPQLARITGLSNAIHTIVLTVTSATSTDATNAVYLDWVASGLGNKFPAGPTVLVGGTPGQAIGSAYNDSYTGTYRGAIQSDVNDLASDGLNVVYVDPRPYQGLYPGAPLNDCFNTDNTHPTDCGHVRMAYAYIDALNSQQNALYKATGAAALARQNTAQTSQTLAGGNGAGGAFPAFTSAVQPGEIHVLGANVADDHGTGCLTAGGGTSASAKGGLCVGGFGSTYVMAVLNNNHTLLATTPLGDTLPMRSIRLPDGSSSIPSLTFAGEPTTGMYRSATGDVRFAVAGTNVARWSASGFTMGANGLNFGSADVTGIDTYLKRTASGTLALSQTGTGTPNGVFQAGSFVASGSNTITYGSAIASTASAGSAGALPSAPAGYISVTINGTVYKIPYFGN